MKIHRIIASGLLGLLLISSGVATAQDITCNVPMTAAAAGTNSPATGTFEFAGTESPLSIEVTVAHNVAGATSIEIRSGAIGQTGALITNLGGATASPTTYTLTNNEAQAILAAGIDWYVIVSSGTFPSPAGAIRVDGFTCLSSSPGEGEGTVEGEGEEGETLPEGLGDYECNLLLNGAQVVPANATGATATAQFTIIDSATAQLRLQASLATLGTAYIYLGSPGEAGEQIRRLGNIGTGIPFLLMTLPLAELEDYTSIPHYIEIDAGAQTIRADIVGCEFDDGVPDPEGEGEGLLEGEGEGQAVDCLVFPNPNPDNLICAEDLSGANVVPPTTSSFTGSLQVTGPIEPGNQYALVVRHNMPAPTSIGLYLGEPGESGQVFLSFTSNLTCPFVALLPSTFLEVLEQNPMYLEIVDAGDTNATLRADLPCTLPAEGEGQTEGTTEGQVGEGEGEPVNDLAGIADFLLLTFPQIDTNPKNGRLNTAEATGSVPTLTAEQFQTLDTNGDGGLTPGELHRFAGPVRLHNADINGDKAITLSELLRVVALFNAAGYACVDPAGSTEDGFTPVLSKEDAGKGGSLPCQRHASDYSAGGDFEIDLSELLRTIQLFYFDTYSYFCPARDSDDFCTEFEAAEGEK